MKDIDELIEASSLGTPEAKALRAQTRKETVDAIMARIHRDEEYIARAAKPQDRRDPPKRRPNHRARRRAERRERQGGAT